MKYAFFLILVCATQITWASSNLEDTKLKLDKICEIFRTVSEFDLSPEKKNEALKDRLISAQVGSGILNAFDAILLITPSKRSEVFQNSMSGLLKTDWQCNAVSKLFPSNN